jgi:hypothetical protein
MDYHRSEVTKFTENSANNGSWSESDPVQSLFLDTNTLRYMTIPRSLLMVNDLVSRRLLWAAEYHPIWVVDDWAADACIQPLSVHSEDPQTATHSRSRHGKVSWSTTRGQQQQQQQQTFFPRRLNTNSQLERIHTWKWRVHCLSTRRGSNETHQQKQLQPEHIFGSNWIYQSWRSHTLQQGCQTYGLRAENCTRKDFLGTQHSLLS